MTRLVRGMDINIRGHGEKTKIRGDEHKDEKLGHSGVS
jgi:hypothetical protein